jgi:hypothetical protein
MAHCHESECAYCRADELFAEDYREIHGLLRTYGNGCRCDRCTAAHEASQARRQAGRERRRQAYAANAAAQGAVYRPRAH